MGTAAEFLRKIPYGNHAYGLTVFFTEESHGSALLGIFNAHYIGYHIDAFPDFLIDKSFYFGNFFYGHCLGMAEVKTGSSGILIRALLLYMVTEHCLQRRLQKVGCGMVLAGIVTVYGVHA